MDLQLGQKSNLATIEQLASAKIPDAVLSDSVTLKDLRDNVVFVASLFGGGAPERDAAFAEYFDKQYAMVTGVTNAATSRS